jgi:hypothetical protein
MDVSKRRPQSQPGSLGAEKSLASAESRTTIPYSSIAYSSRYTNYAFAGLRPVDRASEFKSTLCKCIIIRQR